MKKIEIKPGDCYGRWTIIKEVEPHIRRSGQKDRKVLCKCSCGNETEVQLGSLRSGTTISCGCYRKETHTTHGLGNHPLYKVWFNIKDRCYDTSHNYGGRGISVCDEWLGDDPKTFIDWAMANGYEKELEIDRIDNEGNYKPSNCRFVTSSVNQANRRVGGEIKYRGVSFHKPNKKYATSIKINGKKIHLGYYETAEEAARAWDDYIIKNNIQNRQLNFKGENNE